MQKRFESLSRPLNALAEEAAVTNYTSDELIEYCSILITSTRIGEVGCDNDTVVRRGENPNEEVKSKFAAEDD